MLFKMTRERVQQGVIEGLGSSKVMGGSLTGFFAG